jgi:hypothetical protein
MLAAVEGLVAKYDKGTLALGLLHVAQTARAHGYTASLVAVGNGHLLEIRLPTAVGSAFGMADVVAKLGTFATDLAFSSHVIDTLST